MFYSNILSLRSWNGYNDELVWGALWLYKATGESDYLEKAKKYYDDFNLNGEKGVFSWDDKNLGNHALLAELTDEPLYKRPLQEFCDQAINGQTTSPGGEKHYTSWGSLRYASNAAFVCLQV